MVMDFRHYRMIIYVSAALMLPGAGMLSGLYAESEGEALFRLNKPEAAIPILEKEIQALDASPDLYVFLGVSYYQTEKYEHSISIFETGMTKPGADLYALNFNAGNSAFAMKNYLRANDYYAKAVALAPEKSAPMLNLANTLLKLDRLQECLEWYNKFLILDLQHSQADHVRELIPLIEAELERRRKQAEENASKTVKLSSEESTPVLDELPEVVAEPVEHPELDEDIVPLPGEEILPENEAAIQDQPAVLPQAEYMQETHTEIPPVPERQAAQPFDGEPLAAPENSYMEIPEQLGKSVAEPDARELPAESEPETGRTPELVTADRNPPAEAAEKRTATSRESADAASSGSASAAPAKKVPAEKLPADDDLPL